MIPGLLFGVLLLAGCDRPDTTTSATPVQTYEIVASFPHDTGAFTQGFQWQDGRLFESTGLHGRSSLREVELETGRVLRRVNLPDTYFGEGIALVDDRIVMLTWREETGWVFDRDTFRMIERFTYEGEGWGLAFDGERLIKSNGSHILQFVDPDTFEVLGHLEVRDQDRAVPRLNELAYIDGEIWANVFPTHRIVRIDPQSGMVMAWVDLTGLPLREHRHGREDVLNGIAYDADNGRLLVTGKLWSRVYHIEVR